MTTTAQTIQGYYQHILLRTGSIDDVTYWANQVDQGGIPLSQVENQFATSTEAQTFVYPVTELYQAYLGRTPDTAGLTAWVSQARSGVSLQTLEADFASSSESQKFYGTGAPDSTFVEKLYNNVLGRPAESTDIETKWVNSGLSRSDMISVFLNSAEAQNLFKSEVPQYLLDLGSGIAPPTTLSGVASGTPGGTFTLTTGADTITPTTNSTNTGGLPGSGNDTFNGLVDIKTPANNTLNTADTIDGGSGNNSLNLTVQGDSGTAGTMPAALISNVQTLNVRNVSTNGAAPAGPQAFNVDASLIPGLTAVNSTLSTGAVVVTNLASGASLGETGNGTLVNNGVAATYVNKATAATLNLSGGTTSTAGSNPVNFTGAGITSTTVNSTGAANAIGALTLPNTSQSLTVNAASDLTVANVADTGLKTITVTGAASSVKLGTIGSPGVLSSVNATGLSGGLSVDLSAATTPANFTFAGGQGDDTLIVAKTELTTLTAASQLDGGTGTNTLQINDIALASKDYAALNATKNFQVLGLGTGGATVDASQITAPFANHFLLAASNGGGDNITGLASGSTIDVLGNVGGDTFAPVAGASSLNLNVGSSKTTGVNLGYERTTGFTTINLSSNGKTATPTTPNFVTLGNSPNTTLNIKGSEDLNLTLAPIGPDSGDTINASSLTGKLTLVASPGNDSITVGNGGSDITAGLGADQITLASGAGVDTMRFAGGDSLLTAPDAITNFTAGSGGDVLDATSVSNHYTALNSTQLSAIAASGDLATAAGLAATDANAVGWTAFSFQSNTYAENTKTAGAYTAGTDNVVNLKSVAVASLTQANFA